MWRWVGLSCARRIRRVPHKHRAGCATAAVAVLEAIVAFGWVDRYAGISGLQGEHSRAGGADQCRGVRALGLRVHAKTVAAG